MCQNPCVDPVFFICIYMVRIIRRHVSRLLDHLFLFCKILLHITAVYLHVKREFLVQKRILILAEHQRHRSTHQGKRKQRSQGAHCKLHRSHLRRKLSEQKQILFPVNSLPAPADIANDPSGQPQIEKIDRYHQGNEKHRCLSRTGKPSEHFPEHENKKNRHRQ